MKLRHVVMFILVIANLFALSIWITGYEDRRWAEFAERNDCTLDGLAKLYGVVDFLRLEVRGCTEGYGYYDAPKELIEFLKEERKRPVSGRVGKQRGGNTPRHHQSLLGNTCMMVDLSNGFITSLGFPVALDGKLWFPAITARLIRSKDFYQQISALERPVLPTT